MSSDVETLLNRLWRTGFQTEREATLSAEFHSLCEVCRNLYCGAGALLSVKDSSDLRQQRSEIKYALRHLGAPWFDVEAPSPKMVADALIEAYQRETYPVTYLMPLDWADDMPLARFGPCTIAKYSENELSNVLNLSRVKRFEEIELPDLGRFSEFSWLLVKSEPRRNFSLLRVSQLLENLDLDEVGRVRQTFRKFPADVERAMFVCALYPWEAITGGKFSTWQPFHFPWVHVGSEDPFLRPAIVPDPSTLTWDLQITPEGDEYEMPRRHTMKNPPTDLQSYLQDQWEVVSMVMSDAERNRGPFNPLVEHYFLRAFEEDGIDQLLWNIAVIDAAIGRRASGGASELAHRIGRLTGEPALADEFKKQYKRRSEYIHGKRIDDSDLWEEDVTSSRKLARIIVTRILELAGSKRNRSRKALLRHLDS